MTENINGFKAAVAAVVAALTALWGWYGWFVCLLALCMLLDYITGSAAGMKAGEWSSKTARTGLWHKLAGAGIITNPAYWKGGAYSAANVQALIIKMAAAL